VLALGYRRVTNASADVEHPREWVEAGLQFAGFIAFTCKTRADSRAVCTCCRSLFALMCRDSFVSGCASAARCRSHREHADRRRPLHLFARGTRGWHLPPREQRNSQVHLCQRFQPCVRVGDQRQAGCARAATAPLRPRRHSLARSRPQPVSHRGRLCCSCSCRRSRPLENEPVRFSIPLSVVIASHSPSLSGTSACLRA